MDENALARHVEDGWLEAALKTAQRLKRQLTEDELRRIKDKCVKYGRLNDSIQAAKMLGIPLVVSELKRIKRVCAERRWWGSLRRLKKEFAV